MNQYEFQNLENLKHSQISSKGVIEFCVLQITSTVLNNMISESTT